VTPPQKPLFLVGNMHGPGVGNYAALDTFGDREDGLVSVSIEKDENEVTLVIKDDGIGFSERALKNKSPGFGLTIVKMLVEQLGGTYTLSNDDGARSVVQFKA
jgi:two-component sensor histidine kinase